MKRPGSAKVYPSHIGRWPNPRARRIHAYQWFLPGTMAAYTPCLIFLAFMLGDVDRWTWSIAFEWRAPDRDASRVNLPGDPSNLRTVHAYRPRMLVCGSMFGDMKRRMTVADAQPVNHRRSALRLSQSDWSCRCLVPHRCQWGGPTSREATKPRWV